MPSTVSNCITSGQRVAAAKNEASDAESSLKRLSGTSLIPMIFEGTREVDYDPTGWDRQPSLVLRPGSCPLSRSRRPEADPRIRAGEPARERPDPSDEPIEGVLGSTPMPISALGSRVADQSVTGIPAENRVRSSAQAT